MRLLVVDDELGIREGCRRALRLQGWRWRSPKTGPPVCTNSVKGSFEVLLVDAMMPGMSGLEMMQQVRKIAPEIIGIIITGYATIELAVQAIREGANDFIAKPFTHELLLHVINRETGSAKISARSPEGERTGRGTPRACPGKSGDGEDGSDAKSFYDDHGAHPPSASGRSAKLHPTHPERVCSSQRSRLPFWGKRRNGPGNCSPSSMICSCFPVSRRR